MCSSDQFGSCLSFLLGNMLVDRSGNLRQRRVGGRHCSRIVAYYMTKRPRQHYNMRIRLSLKEHNR